MIGGEAPGLLASFAAGLLSFLSPCVLPLVPSYLGFLGGVSAAALAEGRENAALRRLIALRALAFVAGFSAVFAVLGVVLSGSAAMLGGASRWIGLAAGILVVVLGLNFVFDFIKVLNYEKRFHGKGRPAGSVGAFLFGAAFAAGWSPCVGPLLASILFLAAQGSPASSVPLLLAYSAGLGLPFLAAGVFFGRARGVLKAISARLGIVRAVSGLFLVAVGISMVLGSFGSFSALPLRAAAFLADAADAHAGASRWLGTGLYAAAFAGAAIGAAKARTGWGKKAAWACAAALAALAAAQGTGLIDSARILSSWLKYRGI